jgi:hypothetical protein
MKTYYLETRINYVFKPEEDIDELLAGDEYFTFIVQAKSKVSARQQAFHLSEEKLLNEFGNVNEVTGVVVTDIYETSEDARL